jgi:calcineurin-like phosphoesterase family protein
MKKWITADWHLGETRFDIMQRPFTDVMEHCEFIISRHNSVVDPNDVVYVLGDVIYKDADPSEFLPMVRRMNGIKLLIRGNHDAGITDQQFSPYFAAGIIADGGGGNFTVDGIKCYATHYPSSGKKDAFNLVGHIHGAWRVQLNCLNVGVDVHNYYPLSFDKIPFHFNAISKFYDRDTFAGYLDLNESFKDSRGKKTSYYTGK